MRKIRAIFIFTLLVFAILSSLYAERIKCVWTGIERIVAVGDLHGDYEAFIYILKVNKIIDEENHWIAGKTHLVQIGDIFDRGTQAKRILDFLMILEKEAEAAGGKVHALIGNHEFMNIAGIAFDYRGYVSLDQFVSFLPKKYVEEMEMKFRQKIGENPPRENNSDYLFDPNLKTEWLEFLDDVSSKSKYPHPARLEYSRNLLENYGEWLTNKNAVIKINDIIFVHGGLNEKYSKRNLEKLNESIRKELKSLASAAKSSFPQNTPAPISFDSNGPLWYRDLATIDEKYFEVEVDRILENLKAKHMVIAHTPILIAKKMQRFNKKIWIIDTGISEVYINGRESALIIENGEFYFWLGDPRERETPPLESTIQTQNF